jgi:hypothetical protein
MKEKLILVALVISLILAPEWPQRLMDWGHACRWGCAK